MFVGTNKIFCSDVTESFRRLDEDPSNKLVIGEEMNHVYHFIIISKKGSRTGSRENIACNITLKFCQKEAPCNIFVTAWCFYQNENSTGTQKQFPSMF